MTAALKTAAQHLIDRWDSPLWKDQPHTGVYIAELRKALADEQAHAGAIHGFKASRSENGAVFLEPTSLRPPRTAQEFKFGMEVLNWNRAQQDPPIDIGRELWVADEVLKLPAFNDRPAPPATGERAELVELPVAFGEIQYQRPSGQWGRIEGYTRNQMREAVAAAVAKAEAKHAQQVAAPYDQQALELCDKCGWKAIMPGDPCFVCNMKTEAQQVEVPAGLALVPIEPTPEMIAAARDLVVHDTAYEGYRSVYKAMLAAAQGAKP